MDAMKTALVTGSTDGIGRQTALALLRRGLRVIVHGRSEEKVRATIAGLREELGASGAAAPLEGWACDLSSLAEVRARGAELLARLGPRGLDVLLHNASVIAPQRTLTAEGFELTLAVSHLAPFVLTHALLPALRVAAPARVVLVSSQVHGSGRLDLDDLTFSRGYSGTAAYARAKLANVLFADGLAARFPAQVLTANSLHPGVVSTKLLRQGFGMARGPDSLEEGAKTSVYAATAPELAQVSGRYFVRSREVPASAQARSPALREALWAKSEELTGIRWAEAPKSV